MPLCRSKLEDIAERRMKKEEEEGEVSGLDFYTSLSGTEDLVVVAVGCERVVGVGRKEGLE